MGPFDVTQVVSPMAYRLKLPTSWRLHDVFHISKLMSFEESNEFPRDDFQPPGELLEEENGREYEVEKVLAHRGKGRNKEYLLRWKGYAAHEDTWEPERNLKRCHEVVNAYNRKHEGTYEV